MLQRFTPFNLHESIQTNRQQFSQELQQLSTMAINEESISHISGLINQMVIHSSTPCLTSYIIKQQLNKSQLQHQQASSIGLQLMFNKAQMLYIESIIIDLARLGNQQHIIPLNTSQIKQQIEEMNWKVIMQKSSLLHQQQKIAQDVTLMKFFQGIRNYQSWQEKTQKQSIQYLRKNTYQFQLQISLEKGFLIAKMQNFVQKLQKKKLKSIFDQFKIVRNLYSLFTKIKNKSLNNVFQILIICNKNPSIRDYWNNLFNRYRNFIFQKQLIHLFRIIKQNNKKIKQMIQKIKKIYFKKTYYYMIDFLKNIQKWKILQKGSIIEKIINILYQNQKYQLNKQFLLKLGLSQYKFKKIFLEIQMNLQIQALYKIKIISQIPHSKQLSLHLKGKILLSLQPSRKQPLNLRKIFLNWYIKGNKDKFSKELYNIWLNGQISKFTFFMRLKNTINESLKYQMKIKRQLKIFLIILCDHSQKYYDYNMKLIVQKWVYKTRMNKKLANISKLLLKIQEQSNSVIVRQSFQILLINRKRMNQLKIFCNKYMKQYLFNIQTLIEEWKNIPNINKNKGKIQLKNILRKTIKKTINNEQDSFNIFKQNYKIGKLKKIHLCQKVFRQDYIYLSRFLQIWKFNVKNSKKQSIYKQKSIHSMQYLFNKFNQNKIYMFIKLFHQKFIQYKNNKKVVSKLISKIVQNNKQHIYDFLFTIMHKNLEEGRFKKNKLVMKFVSSVSHRELSAFHLYRSQALELKSQQKCIKTNGLFESSESTFQKALTIFDKKQFIYNILNKIIQCRMSNIYNSFIYFKKLPTLINWNKRQKAISFHEKITFKIQQIKINTLNIFKIYHVMGKMKQKKVISIMAYKYLDVNRRYFNIYRKQVKNIKNDEIFKQITKVFASLENCGKSNFQSLFESEAQWQLKAKSIQKMNQKAKNKMKLAFKLWNEIVKSMKYFQGLQNQKKLRCVQLISKTLDRNLEKQSKKCIRLFQKNRKITKLQTTFLQKLCETQAGKVIKAMMIWKGLPQPKNRQKIARATKFEAIFAKLSIKNMKITFNYYKQNHYFGNEQKKVAIRTLIAKTSSGLKGYFDKWKSNNQIITLLFKCKYLDHFMQITNSKKQVYSTLFEGNQANQKRKKLQIATKLMLKEKKNYLNRWKINNRQLKIQDKIQYEQNMLNRSKYILINFSSLVEITKANYILLFENRREYQIKKKVLENLLKTQKIKMKGFIRLWNSNIKELKIIHVLDKKTKSTILEKINNLVQTTSTNQIKNAIKMFHLNSKIQSIQRKFMDKLLQTKGGKVLYAFNCWKQIPVQIMTDKYKNVQKFYFKMQTLVRNRVKEVNKFFLKQSYEQGSLIKKQSIIKMLDITSIGTRRYYNRWDKITKRNIILQTVNLTLKCMQQTQQIIRSQYLLIFQNQKAYKIKINTIERLIRSCQNTSRNYFKKWKDNIQAIKIQQQFTNEKKNIALKIFTKALQNSSSNQTLQIIRKFKKNSNITKISRNFFNRLLQTKSGSLLKFFERLKSIPNTQIAKRKKNAINFERCLQNFYLKRIKQTINPFKLVNYEASVKKKYCIDKLIRRSMGDEKKKFLIWLNISRSIRIIDQSILFDNIFGIIQKSWNENLYLMIKDSKQQYRKKQQLCRKMINNSLFVKHHVYLKWKQVYLIDNIKITKQEANIKKNLNNLINIYKQKQLRHTITIIQHFKIILEQQNHKKDNQIKQKKYQIALQFYKKLTLIKTHRLSLLIRSFKDKKIQFESIEKIQAIQNSFDNLSKVLNENFQIIIRSERENQIIQKALKKLFNNFNNNLSRAFNLWKQNKNILNIQSKINNQKKKNLLSIINNMLNINSSSQILNIIYKFKKNSKMTKLQCDILFKILNCKAGKVPILFMKWKSLPVQNLKKNKLKAIQFQSKLYRMHFTKIKETFETFRDQQFEGNVKKKYAMKKLIQATLSDSNRLFSKWRKIASETIITQKITALETVFSHCDSNFKQNLPLFQDFNQQRQKKVNLISRLFSNNLINLHNAYNLWRKNTKVRWGNLVAQKLSNFEMNKNNQKLIRQAFQAIIIKSCNQTLRGYINSLWKWKLSNIQANYYAKFIKVFRQSQEIIGFSNYITKRVTQNLHYGFTHILRHGKYNINRKSYLIEKYFSKKIRTYLERFKIGTLNAEIVIWKSKYTESIKAKIINDILFTILMKKKALGFSNLRKNSDYCSKIFYLIRTLQIYQYNTMFIGFFKLKRQSYAKFIYRINSLLLRIGESRMLQSFLMLKNNRKILIFIDKVQNSMMKYLLKISIFKIYQKSQRAIKAKLSLLLLQSLIQFNKKNHGRQIIKKFINKAQKYNKLELTLNKLSNRLKSSMKELFKWNLQKDQVKSMYMMFRRANKLKDIIQNQDNKLLKIYFTKLRKKNNPWQNKSIQMFATKSSILSSLAISLWRLERYTKN